MSEILKQKVQVGVFCRGRDAIDRVLLLQTTAERGGFWQPVTGSVEPGEALLAAAVRELAEETGLVVAMGEMADLHQVFEFDSRWGGRARESCFAAFLSQNRVSIVLSNEHQRFQWCDERQALSLVPHENVQKVLKIGFENARKIFCVKR